MGWNDLEHSSEPFVYVPKRVVLKTQNLLHVLLLLGCSCPPQIKVPEEDFWNDELLASITRDGVVIGIVHCHDNVLPSVQESGIVHGKHEIEESRILADEDVHCRKDKRIFLNMKGPGRKSF